MESFFMLNGGQMAGPSASNHGQWLPNVSSHTTDWWDENNKVVGNSSNRNSTITASNISQAPFLWIISLSASVFVVLLKTPQNLFVFRGRLKIFWINLQTTNRDLGCLCVSSTHFHSFLHLPIMKSPVASRPFPNTKPGAEQNVQDFKPKFALKSI